MIFTDDVIARLRYEAGDNFRTAASGQACGEIYTTDDDPQAGVAVFYLPLELAEKVMGFLDALLGDPAVEMGKVKSRSEA